MKNLREILRDDPDALDRLIRLMSFVHEHEQRIGRKWTDRDWRCLEAVVAVSPEKKHGSTPNQ